MGATGRNHSLPAVHAVHLAALLERWGIAPERLFEGTGLIAEALCEPGARLPLTEVATLARRAETLTQEPGLGLFLGLQMRVSAHGFLGFAAMSAPDVGSALRLATRFARTRTTALALSLEVRGEHARLVVHEQAELGAARHLVLFALLVGLWQLGNALTGRELEGHAELAVPSPPWAHRYEATLRRVRFGAPEHALVFPRSHLALPLVDADPASLELAQQQLERAMLELEDPLLERVRAALPTQDGFRSLEQVASRLHLSPRTLKRHLAARGQRFSEVLGSLQRERAFELLRAGALSLAEVASRLGYSDVANFTRAFRRWTDTTPGAWRRRQGVGV